MDIETHEEENVGSWTEWIEVRRSQHRDHLPFLRKQEITSCEAFFAICNSKVRRPTIHSSSAIRSRVSRPLAVLPRNSGAGSTSYAFQWERSCGFSSRTT